MKFKLFLIAICLLNISFSQTNDNIDKRLSVNKELGVKAAEYYNSNKAEYDFLVYELDNSFFIQSIDKVPVNHKNELRSIHEVVSVVDAKPFDIAVLNDLSSFNFHAYTFTRSQTMTIGYDLGNGQVLVFYSIQKVRENYYQQASKIQK